MQGKRLERVESEIVREVSRILLREVKDPRLHLVSLTRVKVSPDLSCARIFVSVIGDEAERRRVLAGLESAKGFIRGELGRNLRLRCIPELIFKYDEELAQAFHIQEVIAGLKKSGGEGSGDE